MLNKFKAILKIKFSYKAPTKTDILIFDNTSSKNLYEEIKFDKIKIGTCFNRLEELNLNILFKTLFKKKISYQSYLIEYIRSVKPKIVVTFIDNNLFFYKLKKEFPNTKFVSIQNGYRFLNDEMLSVLFSLGHKVTKSIYSSDYYLVFNNQMKKLMEKYINTKCIVIGSLRNNKIDLVKFDPNPKESIGFISRFTPAILRSTINKNIKDKDYIVHKFSSELLCNVARYCQKYNKKLMILTSRKNFIDDEKKYYKKILTDHKYEFLTKENEFDSYKNLLQVDLAISPSSTLGSEGLGRGMKVISFSEDKILGSNFGWPFLDDLQGSFFSNNYQYSNVEKMINYVLNLNNEEWNQLLTQYQDYTCHFDYQNKKLKKIISDLLIKEK